MSTDENLGRIADALEHIASSLEYFEHLAAASRPAPRLRVDRGSGDIGGRPPVTLAQDGRLTVVVVNEGELTAEVTMPQARFGSASAAGSIIGKDGQPHDRGDIVRGGVATLTFDLDRSAYQLFGGSPLELSIPHSPGRFPIGNTLEVQLEPVGLQDGRYGWRPTSTREVVNRATT